MKTKNMAYGDFGAEESVWIPKVTSLTNLSPSEAGLIQAQLATGTQVFQPKITDTSGNTIIQAITPEQQASLDTQAESILDEQLITIDDEILPIANYNAETGEYTFEDEAVEIIQHNDGTIEKVPVTSAPSTLIEVPTEKKTLTTGSKIALGAIVGLLALTQID